MRPPRQPGLIAPPPHPLSPPLQLPRLNLLPPSIPVSHVPRGQRRHCSPWQGDEERRRLVKARAGAVAVIWLSVSRVLWDVANTARRVCARTCRSRHRRRRQRVRETDSRGSMLERAERLDMTWTTPRARRPSPSAAYRDTGKQQRRRGRRGRGLRAGRGPSPPPLSTARRRACISNPSLFLRRAGSGDISDGSTRRNSSVATLLGDGETGQRVVITQALTPSKASWGRIWTAEGWAEVGCRPCERPDRESPPGGAEEGRYFSPSAPYVGVVVLSGGERAIPEFWEPAAWGKRSMSCSCFCCWWCWCWVWAVDYALSVLISKFTFE